MNDLVQKKRVHEWTESSLISSSQIEKVIHLFNMPRISCLFKCMTGFICIMPSFQETCGNIWNQKARRLHLNNDRDIATNARGRHSWWSHWIFGLRCRGWERQHSMDAVHYWWWKWSILCGAGQLVLMGLLVVCTYVLAKLYGLGHIVCLYHVKCIVSWISW
jgi:hypothetical protein